MQAPNQSVEAAEQVHRQIFVEEVGQRYRRNDRGFHVRIGAGHGLAIERNRPYISFGLYDSAEHADYKVPVRITCGGRSDPRKGNQERQCRSTVLLVSLSCAPLFNSCRHSRAALPDDLDASLAHPSPRTRSHPTNTAASR